MQGHKERGANLHIELQGFLKINLSDRNDAKLFLLHLRPRNQSRMRQPFSVHRMRFPWLSRMERETTSSHHFRRRQNAMASSNDSPSYASTLSMPTLLSTPPAMTSVKKGCQRMEVAVGHQFRHEMRFTVGFEERNEL